jgi:flagellar hook protein FlgE
MLRSLYTSISGLRNHQTMLDVVGNNIANVNSYGFKASATTFKDMITQTIQGASAPSTILGGTNNRQIGLGMQLDSITQRHTQGALQSTGVQSDLAIQGDGYFRVTNDATAAGLTANTQPTFFMRAGNFTLDANGDLVTSDGFHIIGYPETAPGSGIPDPAAQGIINIPPGTTRFWNVGQDGTVSRFDTTSNSLVTVGWITMAKFANPAGLTAVGNNKWQASVNSGTEATDIPGGSLNNTGMGSLTAGALEMSNVDLAGEFTEMIRAQRGFQANTRVISTSDEVLQELVNLKR